MESSMQHRLVLFVALLVIVVTGRFVGRTSSALHVAEPDAGDWLADARFDFDGFVANFDMPNEESVKRAEWVRNFKEEERTEYLERYSLTAIANEFPIRAGMTISEMRDAIAENEREFDAADDEQRERMYLLGWRSRRIRNGYGWFYFWVNYKHLFHCDIVIESGRVKSVWAMPGNKEWFTTIYYRISGSGIHKAPGKIR